MENFELQHELGIKCYKFYQEVLRLTKNQHGFCFKKNAPFCAEYGVTERTIQRWLKKLEKLGLIKVVLIKNKYRQIFPMSAKCRPNVGVNNKQLTNNSLRDKETDESVINDLKEKHGEELVNAALKIAKKNSKYNQIAYLKTMFANGFKLKTKKPAFKRTQKVIRKEIVPDWMKPDAPKYEEPEITEEDLAIIEQMKQLQATILGS